MSGQVDMWALHADALKVELQRLRQKIAKLEAERDNGADALSEPGRDAYAVAGSLEDGINTDHLHAAAERDGLAAGIEEWREAVTFYEGPEDCFERECDEFYDEDGNEIVGKVACSHMTEKHLTPQQVADALERAAKSEERIRELVDSAAKALKARDLDTVAMNLGQIGYQVKERES